MGAQSTSSGEALTLNQASESSHRYFDPPLPGYPEDVFGLPTESVLQLGCAAANLSGMLPRNMARGIDAVPRVVRILPLLESMQAGVVIGPEEVRPYRSAIKDLAPEVDAIDALAVAVTPAGVGIAMRRALNRRLEQEFPARAAQAIEKARGMVERAEVEMGVEYLSALENPREQFVADATELSRSVVAAARAARDERVRNGGRVEYQVETPSGLAGLFTRVVRAVRRAWDFCMGRPTATPEVTAYDVGAGVVRVVRSLADDPLGSLGRLPMVGGLLLARPLDVTRLSVDRLAFVAPEILGFLHSVVSDDRELDELIGSVRRNPHELRFVTLFKRQFGRYSIDSLQRASVTLLPALRDVLPTEGAGVREVFGRLRAFLRGTRA